MNRLPVVITGLVLLCAMATSAVAQGAPEKFRVAAFWSTGVEQAHVDFACDALDFYARLAKKKHFTLDATTDWSNLNPDFLSKYQLILWLDDAPHDQSQRTAFENYMEHGGGWLGFHVAAYNDKYTNWPWFVNFLGGAVFYENNWPPLPAKLIVDKQDHPATHRLPATYMSPANEFYRWIPSPRLSKDVVVLLTLDPSNYPLGKKDFLTTGDIPVVWTNTHYRMLYINMGHGDKILTDPTQNMLFEDSLMWLGTAKSATTQP